MTKTQISKHANGPQTIDRLPECFGHWNFEFGYCLEFGYWNLGIGIWDFRPITVVVYCLNLIGLLSTLRFPYRIRRIP